MLRKWRQHKHSQTIFGLAAGYVAFEIANWYWPDGGNRFDMASTAAGVIFGLGLQGIIRMFFCEATKEEDPPLL